MGILSIDPPLQVPKTVEIDLVSSKSMSNRLLILQALSEAPFIIENLSAAKDTQQLKAALSQSGTSEIYAGEGGTTFRFLTAYLALQGRHCHLDASEAMKARPVGPLVEALRSLGAKIEYAGEEGHPPLLFKGGEMKGGSLQMEAGQSSQYLSAILMIAPCLSDGLEIKVEGSITSLPYLEMTLSLMTQLGVRSKFEGQHIHIPHQSYVPPANGKIKVESDWSGASYFWALYSLLPVEQVLLKGLQENSVQGDSILAKWAEQQGSETRYTDQGWVLKKTDLFSVSWTEQLNLTKHPDLAQTVLAMYARVGDAITIRGLHTLFHKETDRLRAMKESLKKLGVTLHYTSLGDAQLQASNPSTALGECLFDTFHDHRMAMSLSLLAVRENIGIKDPKVVAKSFPHYWKEFSKFGFNLNPPHPETAP